MYQVIFSIYQYHKEVGSNANEEINFLVRAKARRQNKRRLAPPISSIKAPKEVWPRLKMFLPTSKF